MIPVSDIWDEAKKLTGNCSDDVIYRRINRAVEILANKSDWDPLLGFVDISAVDSLVTLPREVETPLAISYGDFPALGRDQLFNFHLNGPGDRDISTGWRWWQDKGEAVTFRETCPPLPVSAKGAVSDEGKIVWIYGFDQNQQWVRTDQAGTFVDGYPAIIATTVTTDTLAPSFSRITRIRKPLTDAQVELWTTQLIGVYAWDDTEPHFRRLKLDRPNLSLVRIHYRRKNLVLRSKTDLIPLHNAEAVVMMIRALRYYDELDFATATNCEATAVRWLTEEQLSRNPTIAAPIQVAGPQNWEWID